jgi:hypothetical protein
MIGAMIFSFRSFTMAGFNLPKEVTNTFTKRALFHLTDEEIEQMTMYLKVYFFGDPEASEECILSHSNDVLESYKQALARIRSKTDLFVSLSFDFKGNIDVSIPYNCHSISSIKMIKEEYNCSEGCAKDILHLRHLLNWSREQEEEIVTLHNSGVPTSTTLFN